jgi:glucose/arabinose dehydrogenase/mono/diheme cytochrome c family protein
MLDRSVMAENTGGRLCALLFLLVLLLSRAHGAMQLPLTEPVHGYGFTNAFPNLTFAMPVGVVSALGETNRLFVLEQAGRIRVISDLQNPVISTFLDLTGQTRVSRESGLLGLAFHPNFATNGRFFVYRTLTSGGFRDQLSEFRCDPPSAATADQASEKMILSQVDIFDSHNGGELKFGPDGYLYLGLGDEGPGFPDTHDTPQAIDKGFFAGIIRIDVDLLPENLPPNPHAAATAHYRIPRDNPFVGATEFNGEPVDPAAVRTEFYAVGFRNPWRFSFDPLTGQLVCADVGDAKFEEVNIIEPGGNYGWPYMEADWQRLPSVPPGLKAPAYAYPHGQRLHEGNVIIGGLVYRGDALPGLNGKYLFTDMVSGNVWALDLSLPNSTPEWLAARTGFSTFGIHPGDGGILLANHLEGTIMRLIYSDPAKSGIPPRLSEVGAFADLQMLQPIPTALPFEVINPLWSDGAAKQRWVDLSGAAGQITFSPSQPWTYPSRAVWIKHFELEMTKGVPESRRRVETRFLVKTPSDVYGLVYRWGDSRTEAYLVPPEGQEEIFEINDGGIIRPMVWRYPSWDQCRTCHNSLSRHILGFTASQLNREIPSASGSVNQLEFFAAHGYFSNTNEVNPRETRKLAALDDPHAPLLHKARSYLQSNCVQCHQPGGRSITFWDARIATPLAGAALIGTVPIYHPPRMKIIDPGQPETSFMLSRVSVRDPLVQMPPLATTVVDDQFVKVLTDWITTMPGPEWISANLGSTPMEGAAEQIGRSLRLSSAGAGFDSKSFLFLGREVSGSVEISAPIPRIDSAASAAEAGLIFRGGAGQSATFVALIVKDGEVHFKTMNLKTTNLASLPLGAINSIRLVSDGKFVSAWVAENSLPWRQVSADLPIKLESPFYAGFMAASGLVDVQFAAAEFEDHSLKTIELLPLAATPIVLPAEISLDVKALLDPPSDSIVSYYADTQLIGTVTAPPWNFSWTNARRGDVGITAVVSSLGTVLTSAPITLNLEAEPPEVWSLPRDVVTRGDWIGKYGGESFLIPGVPAPPPSGVTVELLPASETILALSNSPAALQFEGGRIASQFHAIGDLEINFSADDYLVHRGALYFVDWLNLGIQQTVSFLAPGNVEPLLVTNITARSPIYLPFAFRAPITIRIHNSRGSAYVTGIFIDAVPPVSAEIIEPESDLVLRQPVSLPVSVSAFAPGREISVVELWSDETQLAEFDAPPYATTLTNLLVGEHQIRALARGSFGNTAVSEPARVTILPADTKVRFLGLDTNTKGWWKSRYGRDGHWLFGDENTLPVWFDVLPENSRYHVWSDSTDLSQALQRSFGDSRFAACFVNDAFSLAMTPLDGSSARVGVYMVDFDNARRAMDILLEDPSGAVLDRREVSDFSLGAYLYWEIEGRTTFRFVSKGVNAVVSAVFLDQNMSEFELQRNNMVPPNSDPNNQELYLADSDGDGVSNGLEYFLGYNPFAAEDVPSITYAAQNGRFLITCPQRANRPDIQLRFRVSDDLVHWEDQTPSGISIKSAASLSLVTFQFDISEKRRRFFAIHPSVAP